LQDTLFASAFFFQPILGMAASAVVRARDLKGPRENVSENA
jgi:hypothetical protein